MHKSLRKCKPFYYRFLQPNQQYCLGKQKLPYIWDARRKSLAYSRVAVPSPVIPLYSSAMPIHAKQIVMGLSTISKAAMVKPSLEGGFPEQVALCIVCTQLWTFFNSRASHQAVERVRIHAQSSCDAVWLFCHNSCASQSYSSRFSCSLLKISCLWWLLLVLFWWKSICHLLRG